MSIFDPVINTVETFIADYPGLALAVLIVTALLLIMLAIALVKKLAKKVIWLIVILAVGIPASPLLLAKSFMSSRSSFGRFQTATVC